MKTDITSTFIVAFIITLSFNTCKREQMPAVQQKPEQKQAMKQTTTEEKQSIERKESMKEKLVNFLKDYIPKIKELEKNENLSAWNAYTTGSEQDYKKMEEAEIARKKFNSKAEKFELLKQINESGEITDPLLKRQLTLIYYDFLENQLPEELMEKMVKISSEIQREFNTFRTVIDGKPYTRNDVIHLLRNSKDLKLREKVWKAHKKVGERVADRLKQLIKLRNEAARKLGFKNYRELQFTLQEYNPEEIDTIFDELAQKTQEPFTRYKEKLDRKLARRFKIKKSELMPYHYADPFFQEAPKFSTLDFDTLYKGKDLAQIARNFYNSFGLNVDKILARSDLFPRKGKSEHAFCFTIDRDLPDIRVLCNIQPSERWMDTILHELGHALYDSYYESSLPWRLKEPAHIFTTEGVAMMFGEMTKNPFWLKEMLKLPNAKMKKINRAANEERILAKLIFTRWSLVMYYFEKALYENPDQDLNRLWWELVEKYQEIKKPEGRDKPDWATKDHIVVAPAYYHNYMMGQLFLAQLTERIAQITGADDPSHLYFIGQMEAGKYLIEKVFKPGASMHWKEFVVQATGKPLGIDAFIKSISQ